MNIPLIEKALEKHFDVIQQLNLSKEDKAKIMHSFWQLERSNKDMINAIEFKIKGIQKKLAEINLRGKNE